ncbi:cytoskeleton-associated protein 4 [Chanos chanos]|uniref:Cytoskeleton-associated protein 4 n=1 Tax=Chanos chanos TaxID=29144 RepID=A0A6J2VKK9_CHACN|nr:cytoskeleton-associated protein 4 [Chanos chanos]
MTTKHRAKNNANSNDKSSSSHQDDVAKKNPKPSKADGSSVRSSGSGSGNITKILAALCYLVLVVGAGFASFYLQQVLEEVNQIRNRNEESVQKSAEMTQRVEYALQQVNSLKGSLEGLESALGSVQTELKGTRQLVHKGEAETRRVEEALQKLQNEILRDLSEGIREVKEARERDFSSLEHTVEERLAELSRSIADSIAEFTEAQGEAQGQLQELKAKVEGHEDPTLLKQELTAITNAVAELHTANQVAEGNTGVLQEQIATVRAELQTRNKEVVSISEEIDSVRSLVQGTASALRQEVSEAQIRVQAMTDRVQSLQNGQEQFSESLQSLEKDLREEDSKVEKRVDELEVRLKVAEENGEALATSGSEQNSRLEALLSKYDSHESSLTAQGQAAERSRQALQSELEGLKSSLAEIYSTLTTLDSTKTKLEAVEEKLDDLGDTTIFSQTVKDLQALRTTVDSLVAKTDQLESHERAISALQSALKKTKSTAEGHQK